MVGTNGTLKVKASRVNWNVKLNLAGYQPTTRFERSPVLGTKTVRVRPLNAQAWLLDYLAQHPQVMSDFLVSNGLEVAEEERAEMIEVLLPDLFAAVISRLDGVMGYGGGDPTPSLSDGLSFRVPVSEQLNINCPAGVGSITGPITAPTSKDDLMAKIAAQRARIAAARNVQPDLPNESAPDAGDGKKPRKTGK